MRTTRVWTYLRLRRIVAGRPHVTLFLGRTKVGDIVQLAVWRELRQILRPVSDVTPRDGTSRSASSTSPRARAIG